MKKRILLFLMFIVVLVCPSCNSNQGTGTGTQVGNTSNSIFSRPTVERKPGQRKDAP